eukprot:Nitzschia sp. Nitz4//scaffold21_size171442//109059//110243//NITZ4_002175-RA/size171442-augustus-gene-0.187-mRNA-1//1//CDS//3329542453//8207//frame0
MVSVQDIFVLSLCTFIGLFGMAVTGFGAAIIFIFVYQVAVLSGYDGNFKFAVFVQALALFFAQPFLLRLAEVRKYASRKMLLYFIPFTILSTPLGQITGARIPTEMIEAVGGFLVLFVAIVELTQKRHLYMKHLRKLWQRCLGNKEDKSIDDSSVPPKEKMVENAAEDTEAVDPEVPENSPEPPEVEASVASETKEVTKGDVNLEVDGTQNVNSIGGSEEERPLGASAQIWTVLAAASSGFLGGLCGIRGPPVIVYFLHPPYPVRFDKHSQRATVASMTATNVAMRIVYYLVTALAFDGDLYFKGEDWPLYVSVLICSVVGVFAGGLFFEYTKSSRNIVSMILPVLLLLCGTSLLLSSFSNAVKDASSENTSD